MAEPVTADRSHNSIAPGCHWVFGYGSLIYKVDFPFLQRIEASICGWERRFWQGSHDHRGTPDAPGRVVTLMPAPAVICKGVAYLIDQNVFEHLDHREKNGYRQHRVDIRLGSAEPPVPGVVYVAPEDNPAFLGPATSAELAAHIAGAMGPSGSNHDYLLKLADALHALNARDPHVEELAALVRELIHQA
ncbi:gamma-glutamylcyclotransferase [Kineobactrum sediminis]|uniref:glutathione-specific gamma-glutamylcyclotransferase n=1 Tax=Kineobactrum sediminis TaxID=1905677 RepID=A0A2N5Y5V8_9GAMM|nr:gamma-glutamylcyclotransferase [Kineobactrum sediminis]PLW83761.1 gamma-glutamylcyclotransferase [Kineobactrum sediminis]